MTEEPLKYSKDVTHGAYRITGIVMDVDHSSHAVVIGYTFTQDRGTMHVVDASIYGAYPNILKKIESIVEQVQAEIRNIEGDNVEFHFKTITIL